MMSLYLKEGEARKLARETEHLIDRMLGRSYRDLFLRDIQSLKDEGHTLHFSREYSMYRLTEGYTTAKTGDTFRSLEVVRHCPHSFLIGSGIGCMTIKYNQHGMPEPDAMMVEMVDHINKLREVLTI